MKLSEPVTSEAGPLRVVFLVARPLAASVDSVLHALKVTDPPPTNPTTPNLAQRMNDIPAISDNVYFATHLAVGLLDVEVWESPRLNIWEKLQQGSYWEHLGGVSRSSGEPGSCQEWSEDAIKTIQAIQILGKVKFCDSNKVSDTYKRLWDGWVYLPVWWNCQEFAIRLAYLLVTTDEAHRTLVSLARRFKEQIVERLAEFRPPQGGHKLLELAPDFLNSHKFNRWLTIMRELEGRVTDLEQFHLELCGSWDWMQERRLKYWRRWRPSPDFRTEREEILLSNCSNWAYFIFGPILWPLGRV